VENKDPKRRPVVCEGETALCRSEEGELWDGSYQLICFKRLSPFFKRMQKGFQDLLKIRPSSLLMSCG